MTDVRKERSSSSPGSAVTFVTPHSPVAATVTEHAPSSVSEEAQRSPRSERLET